MFDGPGNRDAAELTARERGPQIHSTRRVLMACERENAVISRVYKVKVVKEEIKVK
jgi:hypothetical protein